MTWLDMDPDVAQNGRSLFWKYSNEKDPEFRTQVTGSVNSFQRTPQTDFQTGRVLYYPDGKVKWQYRIILVESDGCYTVTDFKPKSILHKALWSIAPVNQDGSRTLSNLIGKTIDIWTEPGVYNATHPRPWNAQINTSVAEPYIAEQVLPDRYCGPEDLTPLEIEKNAEGPMMVGGSTNYYAAPTAPAPQQYQQSQAQQMPPQQQPQYAPQPQQPMPQQPPQQQVYDDLPF